MSLSHGVSLLDNELQGMPAAIFTRTPSPSELKSLSTRFSRLSTLLSSSLLGTVITYSPIFLPPDPPSGPDPDSFAGPEHVDTNSVHVPELSFPAPTSRKQSFNPTVVAAAQSLPPVLSALGIGAVRFLKGVIPVLTEWLGLALPVTQVSDETGSNTDDNEGASLCDAERSLHRGSKALVVDASLHLASLSSLSVLFHTCAPRMQEWSTTIIDALGRCWVGCLDIESQRRGNAISKDSLCVLKKQLRDSAIELAKVCPGVIKVCSSVTWYFVILFLSISHLQVYL